MLKYFSRAQMYIFVLMSTLPPPSTCSLSLRLLFIESFQLLVLKEISFNELPFNLNVHLYLDKALVFKTCSLIVMLHILAGAQMTSPLCQYIRSQRKRQKAQALTIFLQRQASRRLSKAGGRRGLVVFKNWLVQIKAYPISWDMLNGTTKTMTYFSSTEPREL